MRNGTGVSPYLRKPRCRTGCQTAALIRNAINSDQQKASCAALSGSHDSGRLPLRLKSLVLAFFLCSFAAFAQTPSATVVGRVTDSSGAVVPSVTIRVTNVDTNITQQTSSNELGDFTIPFRPP